MFKNRKYRVKKNKRDWIKAFARCHYLFAFILTTLLDLIILLLLGFNFKKIAVSIPLAIILIPFAILTMVCYIQFASNLVHIALSKASIDQVSKDDVRAELSQGAPGSGKTSSEIVKSYILAKEAEKKLKIKYWEYVSIPDDKLSDFEKEEKAEVIEAFEFYQREGTIWCLWSNIPIKDDKGRLANKLTSKHILQEEKLPIYSVAFSDEIGSEFEAKKGTIKDEQLKNLPLTGRFIRHFFDGYWRMTEQDNQASNISIRRVLGRIVYVISQKWVLKPVFLSWLYKKLENHFLKLTEKPLKYQLNTPPYLKLKNKVYRTSKHYSKFMRNFKYYISCIGFRKYVLNYKANEEVEGGDIVSHDLGKKNFYFKSCLNVKYKDRVYHALYKAKNKPLKSSKYKGMYLTREDIEERYKN